MILTLLLWPIAAGVRKHYSRPLQLAPGQKKMRLVVRLVCALDLVFLLGWVVLGSLIDDPGAVNQKLDKWIVLLMIVGAIAAFATLITLVNAVRSWANKEAWIWTKIHDVAIAVACLGFTWFIWHWNLINFNLKY